MARKKNSDKSSRRSKKSKTKIKVNFDGVETRKTLPEEDYTVKVEEVTSEKSEGGDGYLKWKFRTVSKDKKLDNAPLYYNTSLQPQALWNLRNLLEALGVDTPDDEMDLDLEEMVDLTMIASTQHDDYEGKRRSVIVDFYSEDSEGAEVSDDGDGEDGEENSYTADDINAMDADELQEVIDDNDLEVNLKKARSVKKKRAAVLEALEEEDLISDGEDDDGEGDDDADGEDDDDTKYDADDIKESDADVLAVIIKRHELDVNLKKHRSIKKKRAAVVQALDDEDLLEEDDD